MITTISSMPPQIIFSFSKTLLTDYEKPIKIETIKKWYLEKAYKKYKEGTRKRREFDELLETYEVIYGWIKKKEAYNKTKTKEEQERPDIPFAKLNKINGGFGKNIRCAFSSFTSKQ